MLGGKRFLLKEEKKEGRLGICSHFLE